MSRLRVSVGLGLLVMTLGLMVSVSAITNSDEVSAAALQQEMDQERQRLLNGIAAGKVLHIVTEARGGEGPSSTSGAWVYPEYTTGDIWMGVDSDGAFTTYVVDTKNKAGERLTRTVLRDGNIVSTWEATGEQLIVEASGDLTLADWLSSAWTGPSALTDDSVTKESGTLDGRTTAIFEEEITIDPPGDAARTIVTRSEYVVEAPLLFSTTTYEVESDGSRTLTQYDRFKSYELLPADTEIVQ